MPAIARPAKVVRLLAILALAGHGNAHAQPAPPELPPNTMEARVQACIGCHGQQGRGVDNVYFPRLSGKPAGYLYQQLVAFRDGRRQYVPMNYLLAYLPDAYLANIAAYFAAQNPVPLTVATSVATPALLQDGQRIVNAGLPDKGVPACVSCHGAALGGREPGIPGLLGLRADYVSAQLGAWRYGIRTALAPDCMQIVAAKLSEHDVAAVAAWVAAQPVQAQQRPLPAATASATSLPLACGSQTTH